MTKIGEGRSKLWAIEVVVTGLTTVMLLPVLGLYGMDLAAGTIAPDAEWALAAVVGLVGLWIALLKPDSFYQRRRVMRWAVVAALIISIGALANLVLGGPNGITADLLILGAPVVVAIHQLVRLLRLPMQPRSSL
jgi:hypothetical protein